MRSTLFALLPAFLLSLPTSTNALPLAPRALGDLSVEEDHRLPDLYSDSVRSALAAAARPPKSSVTLLSSVVGSSTSASSGATTSAVRRAEATGEMRQLEVIVPLSSTSATATTTPSAQVLKAKPTEKGNAPAHRASNTTALPPPFDNTELDFASCPVPEGGAPPAGVVHSVHMSPCVRSSPEEPCRLFAGEVYVISINYTSYLPAPSPRSSLEARWDGELPSLRYPYSGQSFNAGAYTPLPVSAGESAMYTYNLVTLKSPVDNLTFNVTQSIGGPSLFCASFGARYINGTATGGSG